LIAMLPHVAQDEPLAVVLDRIVREVHARRPPAGMATRIVAIDGPGGSGKSSFARHLAVVAGSVPIVQTDDFATWDNPIDWWPELLEHVLLPLSRGETVRFERSRWGPDTGGELVVVEPADIMILEGVAAAREAFSPYLTYSIWIDAPAAMRLRRGLDRDGSGALEQWRAWMTEEDEYRSRERPDERADLVIRGDRDLWA
jgi:uridine kinase